MWAVLIIVVVIILLILFLIGIYNGMVRARNRVDEAWSGIDVQLKRRHDLIPNLVESVKGYAAHEAGVFEAVTQARAAAMGAQGPAQVGQAEGALTNALGRLFAVAEAYPQLRATENFQQLQAELTNTEDQIAGARRIYNGNVQSYNTRIQTFPGTVFAGIVRLHEARVLRDRGRRATATCPSVSFAGGSGTPPAAPAAPPAPHRRLRRLRRPTRDAAELSQRDLAADSATSSAGCATRTSRRASRSAARNCRAQPGLPQLTTRAPLRADRRRRDSSRVAVRAPAA